MENKKIIIVILVITLIVSVLINIFLGINYIKQKNKIPSWNKEVISEKEAAKDGIYNPEFMQHAIKMAVNSIENQIGGPYGAVIVKNGKIIAETGNQNRVTGDSVSHAEMCCIRMANDVLGTKNLSGCVMYSSSEPCLMCASAIAHAKIDKVYYATNFKDTEELNNSDEEFYSKIYSGETLTESVYVNVENKLEPFASRINEKK